MYAVDGAVRERPVSTNTIDLPEYVGSWDWHAQSNRIYTDGIAARLFGLDPREARAGVPIERYRAGIHPDDRQWLSTYIHQMTEESGVFVAEYRTCPREGEVRWVLTRGRFYYDEDGQPLRSRGVILDITDRKDDGSRFAVEPANQGEHVLERAADQCIALRAVMAQANKPFLLKLVDMVLLELGRELAKLPSGPSGWPED